MTGQAASAPALKSDLADEVNLAHDPAVLPHMQLPQDIAEVCEEAQPQSPHQGEEDMDASEELADPVPSMRATRATNQRQQNRQP